MLGNNEQVNTEYGRHGPTELQAALRLLHPATLTHLRSLMGRKMLALPRLLCRSLLSNHWALERPSCLHSPEPATALALYVSSLHSATPALHCYFPPPCRTHFRCLLSLCRPRLLQCRSPPWLCPPLQQLLLHSHCLHSAHVLWQLWCFEALERCEAARRPRLWRLREALQVPGHRAPRPSAAAGNRRC